MEPRIVLTSKPEPAHLQAMFALLRSFNDAASGYTYDGVVLTIALIHPDTGEVLGGLYGSTGYNYLHVDMLFVPESMRGSGLGTRLMQQAEEEAQRRGCHGAYLETFDFQAPGFYQRLGYAVFGRLENTPPGHTRFFLRKLFA